YFMSRPAAPVPADAPSSGLPLVGWRVRLATEDGTSSSRFEAAAVERPPSSPNDDTYPLAPLGSSGQVDGSFGRPISPEVAKPNLLSCAGETRSCENGILKSAVQPSRSRETATSHTASQVVSLFVSLYQ